MHNVYGPGQSLWQRHRNVLGLWMRAILEGRRPIIFGDGEQRRAFSYDWDQLPAIERAGTVEKASRQVINLGGAKPVKIVELAGVLERVIGTSVKFERQSARHEVRDSWCTTEKSTRLLHYVERTSLHDGIEQMWSWARNAWEAFPERRDAEDAFMVELPDGMPESWREPCRDTEPTSTV
jgi:UDP-glucose 4-epimerase